MTSVVVDQGSYRRLMSNLVILPRRVGIKVYRIALNAWGGIVKGIQVARVRKRTGLLRKSLAVKVVIPDASYNVKHHGKPAYVLVGPSRGVVGRMARIKGASKLLTARRAAKHVLAGGKFRTQRASRYAHLVEKIDPFMEPSVRAGEGPGFAKFAQKMEQGIASEAAKLPK